MTQGLQQEAGGSQAAPPGPPGIYVGVVTGLAAEARIGAALGRVAAGGGTPAGAAAAASHLADEGVAGLISFGLAGGLASALAPGALVVPGSVWSHGMLYPCAPALMAWLGGATGHVVCAAQEIAATRADKHALLRATGAHATDMESGAVAEIAAARGLPFAVLRAICDPADTDLPGAALVALNAGGAIMFGRVLGSLLRSPGQVPALWRLSGQASRARSSLIKRVANIRAGAALVLS